MQFYSLILSRGLYFVDGTNAETILAAIASDEKIVSIDADLLGDGFVRKAIKINLAHVIALIPNDPSLPKFEINAETIRASAASPNATGAIPNSPKRKFSVVT